MVITQDETNTVTVVGTGSDLLYPPSAPVAAGSGPFDGFYKVGGFVLDIAKEITFANDTLTLHNDGVFSGYIGWANFRHTANGSTVGFVFGVERAGQLIFSQRPTSAKAPNLGDLVNVSGGGVINGLANDILSLWVASDTDGTITIPNGNISFQMIEDTSI